MEDWKKRRDELAQSRAIQIDKKYKANNIANNITVYSNAMRSFVKGYDAGRADAMAEYDLLLGETERLAFALRLRKYHDDDCQDYTEKFDINEDCECGAAAAKNALESWNKFKTKKD